MNVEIKDESAQTIDTHSNESFECFLKQWQKDYESSIKQVDLFNPELTGLWTEDQKKYFVKIFYHARGHFHDFLWYMGNYAPNEQAIQVIIKNISEEFGKPGFSHEKLYFKFASCLDANLNYKDIISEKYYLPFIKEFNKGHLMWLQDHDWDSAFSAFAAYERLDNIDYVGLLNLINSLEIPREGQVFFRIHIGVKHFQETLELLGHIWKENPKAVKDAFCFIAEHQLDMWEKLSQAVFNYSLD